MLKTTLTLVYDPICPFAQRAWLSLLEKGLPFEKLRIKLKDKSPQFSEIYSRAEGRDPESDGKVPILVHGERTIAESDLICWYLQQQFQTETSLTPSDSFKRLKMRLFIQNIIPKFVSAFYSVRLLQTKSQEEQTEIKSNIISVLEKIEENIVGPYVLGEEMSLADLFIYPWLERWCVQETLFGISIPQKCQKVLTLKATFEKRPSVQKTKEETSDEFYINMYRPYLQQQA